MRTFISVDIEDKKIINYIVDLQNKLRATGSNLKLVEPENIHLTLYFLGEIDENSLPTLNDIVSNCIENLEPFEIVLENLGAFPSVKRPRVIWLGITKNGEKLTEIANCLRKKLIKLGFRKEEKEFHPHITLARVKYYRPSLVRFLREKSQIYIGNLVIDKVKIKKSTLTPRGPIYEDLVVLSLGT